MRNKFIIFRFMKNVTAPPNFINRIFLYKTMKRLVFLSLLVALLPIQIFAKSEVTLSKAVLLDKIKGGWAGQTIGCTYGGPTEFHFLGTMIPDSVNIRWPKGFIKWYYENAPTLYDDLYMDLTFLNVFHRVGLNAPVDSFAQAFAHAGYTLWHANQAARYNILNGVRPPLSGFWKNNPHADDIDYQIESDYAGLMSPGMPQTASKFSDKIGHIMNYGNGWYGGVFVGAMYTQAFLTDNVNTVVTQALKTIPRKSLFYQCMSDIIRWHSENPTDWKATWTKCQQKYSDERGCPDGVKAPFDIDALINSAYIVIGLLYGEGNFSKTLEISTRCGQDSDCNPSSAGGILGAMLGYSGIPSDWLDNLKEVEGLNFAYTDIALNEAYAYTYELALKVIAREGGREDGDNVVICSQQPRSVRFEDSFSGLRPVEVRQGKALQEMQPIRFSGSGIVLGCNVQSSDNDYVANVEVNIDGRLLKTVKAPANYRYRTQELYWNYDLKEGPHVLSFRWTNPNSSAKIDCGRILIYGKTKNK